MNKKYKEIPIFFASDNNYAPYLVVALKSLLANASKEYFYKIHVLTSNMSDDNKLVLLRELTFNSSIEFINLSKETEAIKDKFHLRDYYSIDTYYRFFIADLFPEYDKVIYLDSDIIVLGDISDLYFYNISNYLLGVVQEQVMAHNECFSDYVEKALGVKCKNYFNAGILLMNSKLFRLYNIQSKFFKLMSRFKFRVTQDEDYLNVICKDKVKYLDLGWNKMPFEETGFDDVDLKIIHYTLGWKPWHYENVRYEEYFWQYASQTEYYELLQNQLKTYGEDKKQKDMESYENLRNMAIADTLDYYNYKNTMEREQRRKYISRGLKTIINIPGIRFISRFIGTQSYRLLNFISAFRNRVRNAS
jgi:lipopolysaccharide biosynthesis glycosyltransferase